MRKRKTKKNREEGSGEGGLTSTECGDIYLKGLKIGCVRIATSSSHENGFDFGMFIERDFQSRSHRSRHGPQLQIVPRKRKTWNINDLKMTNSSSGQKKKGGSLSKLTLR